MFKILEEKLGYKRYLSLWHTKVEFPNGKIIDWDSVGSGAKPPHFVVIFPYNTKTQKVTLIKEYNQGINDMRFTLPSGGFDKHPTILDCAISELNEEACLKDGAFIRLLEEGHLGIPELKWGRNRFIPFLCLDSVTDGNPHERDAEGIFNLIRIH
ncbi:hypothetical protein HK103_004510 [Boothiomyces macroporosus]|uniref:Nudix hydrolase domain-containing protein n=1 Tax=Boothiomyces macroporosus TaxID=261099 RepID=A0AAD5UGF1_9FUNG|nr:hypothetical protein HK103_004510 [Boothiomyces macroporosus]